MTMFPQTKRVPSVHLRAVTRAVLVLAYIKADPNVPEKIYDSVTLTQAKLDEYKLILQLRESTSVDRLSLTSSERQAIRFIELMIVKVQHHRDICLTQEKKEALQQEIDALETVLALAKEAP